MLDRKRYRTKSVGFRVRETDFARLQALADSTGKPLGEWCRETLLERAGCRKPTPGEQTMVSEVLALRSILLNVLFSIAKGKVMTEEEMTELIERADAEKLTRARRRLEQAFAASQEDMT